MSSFFDEKAVQVSPGSLTAFGVHIISRHSKASELIEMLSFVQAAARDDISDVLDEVFYDSNSCCCSFRFKHELPLGDPVERKLLAAAEKTIGQFEWDGVIHHGRNESM